MSKWMVDNGGQASHFGTGNYRKARGQAGTKRVRDTSVNSYLA